MMKKFNHISFLSDYGTTDEFVGIVKCVIADIAPHVNVIDITHDIAAFDVRAGSLALARAISYVPKGVVLAIVDPGVGTSRRAVAVSVSGGEGILIGPDNGLLATGVALAGGGEMAVELTNAKYHLTAPGETFAGRDIFAAVAAHICNGVSLLELGTEIDVASILPGIVPVPREEHGKMLAEVTWVDHFGNCQLNVGPEEIAHMGSPVRVTIGSLTAITAGSQPVVRSVPIVRNFSEIGGGIGLVIDSFGMLALCVDRGSVAQQLDLGTTELVVIEPDPQAGIGIATPVHIGSKEGA
jgi:hypothetical protein